MKSLIQTSCSELLVDTCIDDAKVAFRRFNSLFTELEWEASPPLTIELLEKLKLDYDENWKERPDVVVYDKDGNRAWLRYGDNGYITTGYSFDSLCNHGDERCFPIFEAAIRKLDGRMQACDGGSTTEYENWLEEQKK